MRDKYKRFWMNDELRNIARSDELQQGNWDIRRYLRDLKKRLRCNTVVDFGCGYGRLFPVFKDVPTTYFGVDLNPSAIAEARRRYPIFKNCFAEVDINSSYPRADLFIAFTVFLHMDDKTLSGVLKRIWGSCQKNLVIIEALGQEWRPDYDYNDDPTHLLPLYNRELEEYIALCKEAGFEFKENAAFLNPHYAVQERYADRNCNTDVLIFEKKR